MTGAYIEAKPLSKEQAALLDRIIAQTSFKGAEADGVISLRLALQRIATGVDEVTPVENEPAEDELARATKG